jgi:hypothetical protein
MTGIWFFRAISGLEPRNKIAQCGAAGHDNELAVCYFADNAPRMAGSKN